MDEQKDVITAPRCGHRTSFGKPCRNPAGWGTDHPGVGPCRWHESAAERAGKSAPPIHALANPELRPLILNMIEDDQALFDLRFEVATLRALFATAASRDDVNPRELVHLAKAIAGVAARLREMEVGKHYYIHVNVLGLVLQAVGEVARQYLPSERRSDFARDLQHVLRGMLPAATSRGIAASAIVDVTGVESEDPTPVVVADATEDR